MADSTSSPDKPLLDPIPLQPDPDNPISQPDPSSSASTPPPPPTNPNPNLPPSPSIHPQPPLLHVHQSFRPPPPPLPLPLPPQFWPIPNANFHPQNNVVQPPGVAPVPGPGGLVYAQLPNQNVRPPYMQLPNGYMPLPPPVSSS